MLLKFLKLMKRQIYLYGNALAAGTMACASIGAADAEKFKAIIRKAVDKAAQKASLKRACDNANKPAPPPAPPAPRRAGKSGSPPRYRAWSQPALK